MVSMNRLSTAKRAAIVRALCEGCSIRSTVRITGASKNTIVKLLAELGPVCAKFQDDHIRNLRCRRVQADEIWSFVGAKAKNVTDEQKAAGWGDCWTWTALDADSKLIVSYAVGDRDLRTACVFIEDVASRLANRVQLTTDGLRVYVTAVEAAFGEAIDYAILAKVYAGESTGRYSPSRFIGATREVITGEPDAGHISTSYVERQNLTMRMSMRRFTRLTNGYSKKVANHSAMVSIYFMFYNFARVHASLRVTPAMEAGISDHVWSIDEIIGLLDSK